MLLERLTANVSLYVTCTTGILNIQKTAVRTYLCVALSCFLELSERLLQGELQLSNCCRQTKNRSLLTSHDIYFTTL